MKQKLLYGILLCVCVVSLAAPAQAGSRYIAMIDSAQTITDENQKFGLLLTIASQSQLSEEEQLHLLDVLETLPLDSIRKSTVLLALIKNPAVTDGARDAIPRSVQEMGLSVTDAQRVQKALAGDEAALTSFVNFQKEGPWWKVNLGLIIKLISFIPLIIYILSLQKCLSRIKVEQQAISPNLIWLNLIPVLNIAVNFYVVIKMRDSLRNAFGTGAEAKEDFGFMMGMIMSALFCLGLVPALSTLAMMAGIIFWIVYWTQIAGYSRRLVIG